MDPTFRRWALLPFVAETLTDDQNVHHARIWWVIELTTNVHAVVKSSGDRRIHVDQQVLLLGQLVVAGGDLRLDPGAELLTDDGVGDVDEPLPWDLVHVTVFREVVVDQGDLPGFLKDPSDAKILILCA